MWRCKHVSDALHEHDYKDLPFMKRMGLRIHVMLCFVCGRYNKRIMIMQDTCRHLKEEHKHDHCCNHDHAIKMPDDLREQIKSDLKAELTETSNKQT